MGSPTEDIVTIRQDCQVSCRRRLTVLRRSELNRDKKTGAHEIPWSYHARVVYRRRSVPARGVIKQIGARLGDLTRVASRYFDVFGAGQKSCRRNFGGYRRTCPLR